MDKNILIQYANLREEVKELRDRINSLERQINQMEKEGSVKDSVKGGSGGIQHFKVEGFPIPKYNKKVNSLKKLKLKLESREIDLFELLSQVEEYIYTIEDSRMRRIINLKIIEDMTWQQVANRLGGKNTEAGIKSAFHRFMEKK